MASGAALPFCSFQLVLLWWLCCGGREQPNSTVLVRVCSPSPVCQLSDDLNRYADPLWGATINSMLEFWWQFLLMKKLYSVLYFEITICSPFAGCPDGDTFLYLKAPCPTWGSNSWPRVECSTNWASQASLDQFLVDVHWWFCPGLNFWRALRMEQLVPVCCPKASRVNRCCQPINLLVCAKVQCLVWSPRMIWAIGTGDVWEA